MAVSLCNFQLLSWRHSICFFGVIWYVLTYVKLHVKRDVLTCGISMTAAMRFFVYVFLRAAANNQPSHRKQSYVQDSFVCFTDWCTQESMYEETHRSSL